MPRASGTCGANIHVIGGPDGKEKDIGTKQTNKNKNKNLSKFYIQEKHPLGMKIK